MLKIDHITVAGRDLERLRQGFAQVGLATEYGGPHAAVTHMALLSFQDGSYLELISSLRAPDDEPALTAHPWGRYIASDGGPCAWAVRTDDIGTEAERFRSLRIEVQGPLEGGRDRPDGVRLEWQTVIPGPYPTGAVLPFIIQDVTPREHRVSYQPGDSASNSMCGLAPTPLAGVGVVVLGVPEIEPMAELLKKAYGFGAPAIEEYDGGLKARVAYFAGTPVALASPPSNGQTDSDWLSERLARFGPGPCAFLLGAKDVTEAARHFSLDAPTDWFGRRSSWFNQDALAGIRMGIVE